jgi:hypothetical protein
MTAITKDDIIALLHVVEDYVSHPPKPDPRIDPNPHGDRMDSDLAIGFLLGYLGDGRLRTEPNRYIYNDIVRRRCDRLAAAGERLGGVALVSPRQENPSRFNLTINGLPQLGWSQSPGSGEENEQNHRVPGILRQDGPLNRVSRSAMDGFVIGKTECEGSTNGLMLDAPSQEYCEDYADWLRVDYGLPTARAERKNPSNANGRMWRVMISRSDWPALHDLPWLNTSRVPGMG